MPKYTTSRLELYLKIDSKKIKKEKTSLKNSEILNTLSSFLGYKNYQEVTKRKNDSSLIEMTALSSFELDKIKHKYVTLIEKKYGFDFFHTKFTDLYTVTKLLIQNHSNKINHIDFTGYKTVLKLDNELFKSYVYKSLSLEFSDRQDFNILYKAEQVFQIVLDIMDDNNIKDYQSEYINYGSLDNIKDAHKITKNKELKNRIELYIENINKKQPRNEEFKYEDHGYISMFISHIVFHPYVDMTSKLKKDFDNIINLRDLMTNLPTLELSFHNLGYNYKIMNHLFNHSFNYFIKKELPQEYKDVLSAFKSQAGISLDMINPDNSTPVKNLRKQLGNPHKILSNNPKEAAYIYKLLMSGNNNIDTLTNEILFKKLSSGFELSHLKKNPLYYSVLNKIGENEYFFITKYINDGQSFGGSGLNLEEVLEMQQEGFYNDNMEYHMDCPEELGLTLKHPEMTLSIYSLKSV